MIPLVFNYTERDVQLCKDFLSIHLQYQAIGHPELSAIGGKKFLEIVIQRMESIQAKETTPKMVLNFAHDTTLSVILTALGISVTSNPPFASNIVFELWREGEIYSVRTVFNDQVQLFTYCLEEFCQFTEFTKSVTENVMPGSMKEVCKTKAEQVSL